MNMMMNVLSTLSWWGALTVLHFASGSNDIDIDIVNSQRLDYRLQQYRNQQ